MTRGEGGGGPSDGRPTNGGTTPGRGGIGRRADDDFFDPVRPCYLCGEACRKARAPGVPTICGRCRTSELVGVVAALGRLEGAAPWDVPPQTAPQVIGAMAKRYVGELAERLCANGARQRWEGEMNGDVEETHELTIGRIDEGPLDPAGFHPVTIETSRGRLELRHYPAADARAGVVWMGGVGGGWDTPAKGLYPRLAESLAREGLRSVRVKFRQPTVFVEAVLDALVAANFLQRAGSFRLGFVGHSFGGAVAIQAAAHTEGARTVVTLASQSFGASPAADFDEGISLLALHGTQDEILPAACSQQIHDMAGGRKQLELLPGAGHVLDEAADRVGELVERWIRNELVRGGDA